MRHFSDAYAALRRKNRGQYALAGRVQLLLRAADHCLCLHDALPHHPLRLAGGRRQPQAGDDGVRSGGHRLRRVHRLCRRAVLPAEVPGDRRVPGSGGHPPPAAAGDGQGAGGDLPGLLRRRGGLRRPSGLGRVAAVPPVSGGLPGDGPVLRSPVLSAVHGLLPPTWLGRLFFLGRRSIRRTNHHRHRPGVPSSPSLSAR